MASGSLRVCAYAVVTVLVLAVLTIQIPADAASAQLKITASAGRAGAGVFLSSTQPCPAPAEGKQMWVGATLVDAAGKSWPMHSQTTRTDGHWDRYLLQIPYRRAISLNPVIFSEDAAVGSATLSVSCAVDNAVVLQYEPVSFTVTEPSAKSSVTPTSVTPGSAVKVRPIDACPVGTAIGRAVLQNYVGSFSAADFTADAQGGWPEVTIQVPTSFGAGAYQLGVICWVGPEQAATSYADTLVTVGSGPGNTSRTVSLGDSFSSGEANAPYVSPTNTPGRNMCHRSAAAWPRKLGVSAANHLACSGDTIFRLYESRQTLAPDNRNQLNRLQQVEANLKKSGSYVDRVTLTIGGNDIGFADILGDCYLRECLAHPENNLDDIKALRKPLVTLIGNIKRAAPRAQIVLVGYPRLFPTTQRANVACGWLTPRERTRANDLAVALDKTLRTAADQAGATFVSVLGALAGHELCTADSWMFELNPAQWRSNQQQAHPLDAGQQAIAQSVAAALNLPSA